MNLHGYAAGSTPVRTYTSNAPSTVTSASPYNFDHQTAASATVHAPTALSPTESNGVPSWYRKELFENPEDVKRPWE